VDFEKASEAATGAGGVVRIGESAFLVRQPTPADLLCLRSWVKARLQTPLQAVARRLKDLPADVQEAAVRQAVALEASGSELTYDRVQEELATPEGCGFWLWHLAKDQHAGLTPENVRPLITRENVYAVLSDLLAAARMRDVSPNLTGEAGSVSTASPTTSSRHES
jgi:hypothetical protein